MRIEEVKEWIQSIDLSKLKKREKARVLRIVHNLDMEACRENYQYYVDHVHEGRWFAGKHLVYICKVVQDLLEDKLYVGDKKASILVLSVPPQHGKSMTLTETLPSWYLGNNPNNRVIITAYNTEFARNFGRRNLQKLKMFGKDIFNLEVVKEQDDQIEINNGVGNIISRGIMAGLTGNPANLIIIDDPVKNREEADSDTYRNKMWNEYLNSIKTRLSADGKIILIQTRWHEDDLAGRVIASEGDKVHVINFPCEAEENDVLGREVGDSLFPEIGKDKEWLEDFKRSYTSKEGNRTWMALFQGHPTVGSGNIIKREWFKLYYILPRCQQIIMSVDAAFKGEEDNDFVSIQVWGKLEANIFLIDRLKGHFDFPQTLEAIRHMKKLHPKTQAILVEDKANGPAIISMLNKEMGGIIPVKPEGGKVARVNAVSHYIEAGNVYLPSKAEWIYDFLNECASFPRGAHDDDVDAMSQALNRLIYAYAPAPKQKVKGEFFTPTELEEIKELDTYRIRKVR